MTIKPASQDVTDWAVYIDQLRNGYHLSDSDKQELIRLNYLIMDVCHEIHNTNMLSGLEGIK